MSAGAIQAWTTENSDAIVWGTHDLTAAQNVYRAQGMDSEPDWGDIRRMWANPRLVEEETWPDSEYGAEARAGWVPFLVFGF